MEIRFYHAQNTAPEKAMAELLGKALARGQRILLWLPDAQQLQYWSDQLWQAPILLPHGHEGDAKDMELAAHQPIWLTTNPAQNLNNATILFCPNPELPGLAEWPVLPQAAAFTLQCLVFHGKHASGVAAARALWAAWRAQPNLSLTYWQQDSNTGKWDNTATNNKNS